MRVRPTARGWALVAAGVLIIAIGRALGIRELFDLGTLPIVLLAISVLSVLWRRPAVEVSASVLPERPWAGTLVTVEAVCQSTGRGSPLIVELQAAPELGGPQATALPPISQGKQRWITFDLRPASRGVYELGPLTISAADPFGLVSAQLGSVASRKLFVYPQTEPLEITRDAADMFGAGSASAASAQRGADLYAIRDYHPGDDLRKIHWRSTARVGRPMIRQEDQQLDPTITVVVDDRDLPMPHGQERFEALVSSAASVAQGFLSAGFEVSLMTFGGVATEADKEAKHLHKLLEQLCTIQPQSYPEQHLRIEGPAIIVTRTLDEAVLAKVQGRPNSGARMIVVHTAPGKVDLGAAAARAGNLGAIVLTRPLGGALRDVWPRRAGALAR